MQFKHRKTDGNALMVDTKPFLDDALKIEKPADLPSLPFWKDIAVAPEIVARGLIAIDSYLRAFIGNPDVYYMDIFPSQFPDGIRPEFTRG